VEVREYVFIEGVKIGVVEETTGPHSKPYEFLVTLPVNFIVF
jgi:hypothetical protein